MRALPGMSGQSLQGSFTLHETSGTSPTLWPNRVVTLVSLLREVSESDGQVLLNAESAHFQFVLAQEVAAAYVEADGRRLLLGQDSHLLVYDLLDPRAIPPRLQANAWLQRCRMRVIYLQARRQVGKPIVILCYRVCPAGLSTQLDIARISVYCNDAPGAEVCLWGLTQMLTTEGRTILMPMKSRGSAFCCNKVYMI